MHHLMSRNSILIGLTVHMTFIGNEVHILLSDRDTVKVNILLKFLFCSFDNILSNGFLFISISFVFKKHSINTYI